MLTQHDLQHPPPGLQLKCILAGVVTKCALMSPSCMLLLLPGSSGGLNWLPVVNAQGSQSALGKAAEPLFFLGPWQLWALLHLVTRPGHSWRKRRICIAKPYTPCLRKHSCLWNLRLVPTLASVFPYECQRLGCAACRSHRSARDHTHALCVPHTTLSHMSS